jgi:hypothetical protein
MTFLLFTRILQAIVAAVTVIGIARSLASKRWQQWFRIRLAPPPVVADPVSAQVAV